MSAKSSQEIEIMTLQEKVDGLCILQSLGPTEQYYALHDELVAEIGLGKTVGLPGGKRIQCNKRGDLIYFDQPYAAGGWSSFRPLFSKSSQDALSAATGST